MDFDEEDLVGDPKKAKRRRSRDDRLEELLTKRKQASAATGPMVEDMLAGVTVSWLAQVFGMDPKTVKQKLSDCPPLHRRKAGYVYHLPTACAYLIKPAISPEHYIKNLKPSELPPSLQQTYWDALLKRQKWEENAGMLWRTEKVMEVFSETFKAIKFTLQLWPDTLERQTGLSDVQRHLLVKLLDELQEQIYQSLVDLSDKKKTTSQRGELSDILSDSNTADDDDYSYLV